MRVVRTELVPLASIRVGEYEVRGTEEDPELQDLADSIRRDGLLQAMGVVEREDGYHLVHGHRRYSACVMARVSEVRVDVLEGAEADMERASIIENFHRKDVTPMERAAQISHVYEAGTMTVEELAELFHRSVEWVRAQICMMGWPSDVQEMVHRRAVSPSAAEHLAKIEDVQYRGFLLATAAENGCTERTAVAWLAGWRAQQPAAAVVAAPVPEGPARPGAIMPKAVCPGCHGEFPPDGLGPAWLCPGCIVKMVQGGRVVGRGE